MNTHLDVTVWCDNIFSAEVRDNLKNIALNNTEQEKEKSFIDKRHQNQYKLAHQYLRWVLSKYLGINPSHINFVTNQYGKPAICPQQNTNKLSFNLSHSQNHVIIAVGKHTELGVDIECMKPIKFLDNLAEHCLSPQEYQEFLSVDNIQKETVFYRTWTKKEAYLKALGLGLNKSPKSFNVSLTNPNEVFVKDQSTMNYSLKVMNIYPVLEGKTSCALAVASSTNNIHYRNIESFEKDCIAR